MHHRRTARPLAACLALACLAADWPHWRGPQRDGHTPEPSHFDSGDWLPDEPAWRTNVGLGSTSPLVVAGRLYTMGWKSGRDSIVCLDAATGEELWRQSYPSPEYGRNSEGDKGFYIGPSSTPGFDTETGLLFTLGIDGDLNCWDSAAEGRRVWGFNLYDRYKMPKRPRVGRSGHRDYGYTSSPLVLGPTLIVEVGGEGGTLMAFDKKSGKPLWGSEAKSPGGHNAGPAPITVDGVACVATFAFEGLIVCRVDPGREGETVATIPWITNFANNVASVAVHDDSVIVTSEYNQNRIARYRLTLDGAEKVWERPHASKVCTPVVHDGHVYWSWHSVYCLDYETGELKWKGGRFGDPGSCVVTSDERLIVLGGRGDLALVETAGRSPNAYRELASRGGLFQTFAWPHVVLADGRLFAKDRDGNLLCFVVNHSN